MTVIEYIHERLRQDFGKQALPLHMLLDDQMGEYLFDEDDYDISFEKEGFQILLEDMLYPFLALKDAMDLAEVEETITDHYIHRLWKELPDNVRKETIERFTEISAREKFVALMKKSDNLYDL